MQGSPRNQGDRRSWWPGHTNRLAVHLIAAALERDPRGVQDGRVASRRNPADGLDLRTGRPLAVKVTPRDSGGNPAYNAPPISNFSAAAKKQAKNVVPPWVLRGRNCLRRHRGTLPRPTFLKRGRCPTWMARSVPGATAHPAALRGWSDPSCWRRRRLLGHGHEPSARDVQRTRRTVKTRGRSSSTTVSPNSAGEAGPLRSMPPAWRVIQALAKLTPAIGGSSTVVLFRDAKVDDGRNTTTAGSRNCPIRLPR